MQGPAMLRPAPERPHMPTGPAMARGAEWNASYRCMPRPGAQRLSYATCAPGTGSPRRAISAMIASSSLNSMV